MVERLQPSIARVLSDKRVSLGEVKQLLKEASAQPLSVGDQKALRAMLDKNSDAFGFFARGKLKGFLGQFDSFGPASVSNTRDPSLSKETATDVTWKPVSGGKLFIDGVNSDDVVQGSIANCYMASAFSAVSLAHPEAVTNAIKDNGDGTFTVRFFECINRDKNLWREVEVNVDKDLATSPKEGVVYAHGRNKKELWPAILEKAFAQWKGGYEEINNGGLTGGVYEALTGKSMANSAVFSPSVDDAFARIKSALAQGRPVVAGTYPEENVDYQGTGIEPWHAYTVLGTVEEGGKRYVQLRNPWGEFEPSGNGKNDGVFKLDLATFGKLFVDLKIGD